MIKLFKEFCREENIRTWFPMLSSFLGIFCSPLIGQFFNQYHTAFWITFGVSVFFGIVFTILCVKYLKKWYSIISILRSGNNDHLLETAVYIAATEDNKQKNTNFSLEKIDIFYDISMAQEHQKNKYGVCVRYNVVGTVNKKLSSIYFHVLARKTTSNNPKVEYYFGKPNDKKPWKEAGGVDAHERSGITYYTLTDDRAHGPEERLEYSIRVTFPAERGLSIYAPQRFLFDPENFSKDCKDATAVFHTTLPEDIFRDPQIDVFTDGLSRNKKDGPYSLKKQDPSEKPKDKNSYITYKSIEMKVKLNFLYAIVFCPKKKDDKSLGKGNSETKVID